MSTRGSRRGCHFAVAAVFLVGAASLRAQSSASDAHALNTIFGDEYLEANVLAICSRAADMQAGTRYEFLSGWVLPGDRHPEFRVVADFSPTHPPPTSTDREHTSGFRVPAGGEIVSPALDLIDTATSLDRLEELRRVIEATATSVEDRINQLALLALVDMARDDVPSAQTNLAELFALVVPAGDTAPRQLDPVLLCVHAAADHPQLSLAIVDAAYQILHSYRQVLERTAWQRQYSAAYARVRLAADEETGSPTTRDSESPSRQWFSASLPRARYRGMGSPVAEWRGFSGGVDSLAGHDVDYLYFAVPMRADYEVECDVTSFGYRETQLLVAGKWVGAVWDLESYDLGEVYGGESRIPFSPPLSNVQQFIHYRTAVRNGAATTWLIGRAIHEAPLPSAHDPWLAIRSATRYDGAVRNLSITGNPIIPDDLRLSDAPGLAGWLPYFDESIGAGWRSSADDAGPHEILGLRRKWFPRGCHMESALFYHRPMLENGSIEYEFWYEPGVCEAHPVLDRLCLVLQPDGVGVHWLTDGLFDRTSLAPDNLSVEPVNRRGPGRLPLVNGAWNRLRLTVRGDTLDLLLNGEPVYERNIEPTNQRHFGLFHYTDQTELRVRNVTWTGDWPRELPDIAAQELAVDETGALDERRRELAAVFSHDFVTDGLPPERFLVVEGDVPTDVFAAPDGLHAGRVAGGPYLKATIAPSLSVHGDFDVTASFEQVVTDPPVNSASNIILLALADNDLSDECQILRRRTRVNGTDQQLVQCLRAHVDGQQRRHPFGDQPMEATSGKLRLARRGEEVYYLFAENDSSRFRLIGQQPFPDDDLALHGLRLVAQIHGKSGSTSVVWKDLTIHAAALSGPAVDGDSGRLATLNRQRAELPESLVHDFSNNRPADALFEHWPEGRAWSPDDGGLSIVAPGADYWTTAGASLEQRIEGDFDISSRFDAGSLATPAEGQTSAAYLQLELADEGATKFSMIWKKSPQGETTAIAQLGVGHGLSGWSYRWIGSASLHTVRGFRLARRGGRVSFIVDSEDLGGERIIVERELGDVPVNPGGTRVFVHTGGAGRESRVVWKSIQVHADRIDSVPTIQSP